MDNHADGRANGKPHNVYGAVAHPDELNVKGTDLNSVQGHDNAEFSHIKEIKLPELVLYHTEGERRTIHGDRKFPQEIGNSSHMILMGMGSGQRAFSRSLFSLRYSISGNNNVHPQHVILGKHETGINDNDGVTILDDHHVQTDFTQSAKGYYLLTYQSGLPRFKPLSQGCQASVG